MKNMNRTRKALAYYDRLDEEFRKGLDFKDQAEALEFLQDLENAEKAVGAAFGLDTADINNMRDCEGLFRSSYPNGQAFVRKMVEASA